MGEKAPSAGREVTVTSQIRGGGGGQLVSYDLCYRYDFAAVSSVIVALIRLLLDALASNEGRKGTWKAGIAGISQGGLFGVGAAA